jgi:hypothetical protein
MGRESCTSIEIFFFAPITFWEAPPKILSSGYGGEKKISMFVQDSLPNYLKMLRVYISNYLKMLKI